MTLAQPPNPDQIEVSVFGRGYGEAIAVHYGGGEWLAVDSLTDAQGRPATLGYLESIGVSPKQIRVLVATHWHDDHIKGLSDVYRVADEADFFLSIAMDSGEWREFNQRQRIKDAPRVTSGLKELRAIAALQNAGGPPAKYAIANRILRRIAGSSLPHGEDIVIEALGPVDADISAFLSMVAATGPAASRVVPFDKNDVSVPLWLRIGSHRILLGADLEVVSSPVRGWNAVYGSGAKLDGQASIVKVAHHGSANGHHMGIWNDHVTSDAVAILSPWNRGSKLPSPTDVARILGRTTNAFSSSRFDRKSPGRPGVVVKTLTSLNQVVRARPADVGQVRVRFNPIDPPNAWEIKLIDGAIKLGDLAV